MNWLPQLGSRRRKFLAAVAGLLLVVLLLGAIRLASRTTKIPTTEVQRKEFVGNLLIRGEVKAAHSVNIAAPMDAGDLQIVKLAANGTSVKKGNVVIQFDDTTLKQTIAQDQSALNSAEAEIRQARAAAQIKEELNLTATMKARYDVDRARMEANKQEILSAIDGEKAKLALADAQQKLIEAETKLKADRTVVSSDISSKQQKRDQADFQFRQDQRSLNSLIVRAPLEGTVSVLSHWSPNGPTAFKEGDRAWAGAAIAELPDPSSLKVVARVEEAERGQLLQHQTTSINVDAIPDRTFTGSIAEISAVASMDFNAGWPVPRNFTVEVSLDSTDSRLSPNMSANVRVAVNRFSDAIVVPSAAIFRKSGRTVAYVRHGSDFEEIPVEVAQHSGSESMITKGLKTGQQIALKDPTLAP
jgi:multidrug resistance efflux pump